jgi:tetratricopeptide (TPR) repeat protein
MTILAYFALLGWIPAVLVLFAMLPSRLAATTAVIGAWLLLPPYTLAISSLPDYSKTTAATLGVLLSTLIFDPNRLLTFRPRWFDVPVLLFCFCGIASSLHNGLQLYDGLSDSLNGCLMWGLPYLIGRLYFGNPEDLRFFAIALAVGGLSYVLPCLFEIRMMTSLLQSIYGMGAWGGASGMRLGGYRPNVFFNTGLELGMWMTAASLAGWWLWRCGVIKKIGRFSFGSLLLPILMGTSILCRSTGAIALLVGGMILLWFSVRNRTRLLLASLLFLAPLYVTLRVTNLWSGQQAVDLADKIVGPERAESLEYRFKCENLLITKAVEQPVFGWGAWGRSDVYFNANTPWPSKVPTDGLWIIILGTKGYVGLALLYLTMILPAALFIRRFPVRLWGDPRVAAGSLATVFLILYVVDCLLNAFPNMIYLTLAGGLIGLEPKQLRTTGAGRGGKAIIGQTSRSEPRAAALGAVATRPGPDGGRIMLADRYRRLGRSFKQEGRRNEAEAAWRQALDVLTGLLEAKPGSPELQRRWCDCANDLAWLWANHPDPAHRDPDAAVAMARRMVEQCPNAEVYWNTLGTAYYRAGDDASAVAALDHATALGGGTAFDDVFLAMAHARLGNHQQAELRLTHAMFRTERDYPGHPELVCFCDEARAILTAGTETPSATC